MIFGDNKLEEMNEQIFEQQKQIKQLKQQIEEANKSFNSLHKIMDRGQEENYKLKQQLEEAVEVIEFVADENTGGWDNMKRARQFLVKYRGEK